MRPTLLLRALPLLLGLPAAAQPAPRLAAAQQLADNYFGQAIADPYRWLEDVTASATQAWMKGQTSYARQQLNQLPGRPQLQARLREVSEAAAHTSQYQLAGGQVFYLNQAAPGSGYKLCRRAGPQGPEQLLLDPASLPAPTGQPATIAYFAPAPDGRRVAVGLVAANSESAVIKLLDCATGRSLDADLPRARFGRPQWAPDGRSLFYSRTQVPGRGVGPGEELTKLTSYRHQLGTSPAADAPVLGFSHAPAAISFGHSPEDAFVEVPAGAAAPTAVAVLAQGPRREIRLFVAPLAAVGAPAGPAWLPVCDYPDQVTAYAVQGDHLYLLSRKNAPRYQVLETSLSHPSLATATVAVAQGRAVIEALASAPDALYLKLLDGGPQRLARRPHGPAAKLTAVPLPLSGAGIYEFATDPQQPGLLAGLTSWTRYGAIFSYTAATGRLLETNLEPQGPFDNPPGLVVAEVQVKARDGALVPLSIIYRKGLRRDGTAPALLTGYGAYGQTLVPRYDPALLPLFEAGGVLAVAHVRGGGAYGDEWYHAGFQATKYHTWQDFIACAEYLVKEKYTAPAHLTGKGSGAGGILIGRALTERPNLFGAVIIDGGRTDLLRSETTASGQASVPEFGSVKTGEGFRILLAMSTYYHIRPGTRYPIVLLSHRLADRQVDVWQSLKTAARLQAATTSGRPILLRLDPDAGAGPEAAKDHRYQQAADELALILNQATPALPHPATDIAPATKPGFIIN